ncbi:hypothetical protein [Streptomyces chrestomyceticus]|uniref:hypothetical protein n=1 Tax=Streptomyces chrestomyceticus TaxID=68185 RepID=UPI0033CD7A95
MRRLGRWVLKPAPAHAAVGPASSIYVLQCGTERVALAYCADLLVRLLFDLDRIRQPPPLQPSGPHHDTASFQTLGSP